MGTHAQESSVKWYYSGMQGAPGAVSSWYSVYSILKACLVTGFNELTVDSVVVAGEIATVTRTLGHGYLADQIISVAGASPNGLNGHKRVLSITPTTFTFDATGIADQTATGTIVTKTCSAGWESVFDTGSILVVRSPHPLSPKSLYRIDCSGGDTRRRPLGAYESMSSVSDGTSKWSADISEVTDSNSSWMVYADERTVYFTTYAPHYSESDWGWYGFGDFTPLWPGFTANEFCMGGAGTSSNSTYAWASHPSLFGAWSDAYTRIRRDPVGIRSRPGAWARQLNDYTGNGGGPFPSAIDNGMQFAEPLVRVNDSQYGYMLCGKMRGCLHSLQNNPLSHQHPPILVDGVSGYDGRKIAIQGFRAASFTCRVGVDITGPWG